MTGRRTVASCASAGSGTLAVWALRTPVIATLNIASLRANAPSAIAIAVGSETAPCARRIASSTSNISRLASFEYVTNPRSNQSELPAIAVIAPATRPPVHDSAVATRH